MAAAELIDSFSTLILNDERIITNSERSLLSALLSRLATEPDVRGNGAREAIARAVGEIIAQRAYKIMGNNILLRLLESQSVSPADYRIRSGTVGDNVGQERTPGTRRAMPPVPHSPPSPRGLAPQPAASFPISHRAPVPKGNIDYMRVSRDDTGR
jgi:hypothetical protein